MTKRLTKEERERRTYEEHQVKMQQEAVAAFQQDIADVISNSVKDGIKKRLSAEMIFKLVNESLNIFKEAKLFQIKHSKQLQQYAFNAFDGISKALEEAIGELYAEMEQAKDETVH